MDRLGHQHAAVEGDRPTPGWAVVVGLRAIVHALDNDEGDPAERAGVDGLLERLDGRLEATLRDRGDPAALAMALLDHPIRIGDRQGDGLLHDDVLAVTEGREGHVGMKAGRRRHGDDIDVVATEERVLIRRPRHAPALTGRSRRSTDVLVTATSSAPSIARIASMCWVEIRRSRRGRTGRERARPWSAFSGEDGRWPGLGTDAGRPATRLNGSPFDRAIAAGSSADIIVIRTSPASMTCARTAVSSSPGSRALNAAAIGWCRGSPPGRRGYSSLIRTSRRAMART